jgi:CBS domain-containing protein
MRTVGEFLLDRNGPPHSIEPYHTVREALELMAQHNIGALLVIAGPRLVGVFSERDYARKVALLGRSSSHTQVSQVMSGKVISVSPKQTIEECMELMTHHHIRHLPVLREDQILGLISIGDVVREMLAAQKFMIDQLHSYISG